MFKVQIKFLCFSKSKETEWFTCKLFPCQHLNSEKQNEYINIIGHNISRLGILKLLLKNNLG